MAAAAGSGSNVSWIFFFLTSRLAFTLEARVRLTLQNARNYQQQLADVQSLCFVNTYTQLQTHSTWSVCKWPSSRWKPAMGESSHVFLLSSICTPDSVQHMSATVISPVIPVPSSDSNKGVFHVGVNSKWHQGSGVQSFMSDYRNSLVEGICPATANSSSSTQHSREAQFTFSFQTQENRNSTGSENACRGTDAGRDRKFVFWPSTVWDSFDTAYSLLLVVLVVMCSFHV